MSMPRPFPLSLVTGALLLLAACSEEAIDGPIRVDLINGSDKAAVLMNATSQGLVTFDRTGEVVGGLAERWIVEDGGRSYIFRLKRTRWPDGDPLRAREVARLLREQIRRHPAALAGLKPEIRAMTDEVLEIRLGAPIPSFLQLLAQPAFGIARGKEGMGPFEAEMSDGVTTLIEAKPDGDGQAETVDADAVTETGSATPPIHPPIFVRSNRAALAFARFRAGQTDLVLGATFAHLPLFAASGLPPAVLEADPVNGLFGLLVTSDSDFLANPDVREAISMAIDRDRIGEWLNLSGWQPATTILPGQMELPRPRIEADWKDRDFALRQSYARSIVSNWNARNGGIDPLTIALPEGAGARILYFALAADLRAIGLDVRAVTADARKADFRLIDEVPAFDSALWYLHRVSCAITRPCSEDADTALDTARSAASPDDFAAALATAEEATIASHHYVPIGAPVRFSLVRGSLNGYARSPRAIHPLALLRDPPPR